mmetsp:Transcript_10946/g.44367  ORF Transcript_10946/g.44367 Transcript_10946/m.44367 type:complete len:291 (-) Transcript_10946:1149-2021(-)
MRNDDDDPPYMVCRGRRARDEGGGCFRPTHNRGRHEGRSILLARVRRVALEGPSRAGLVFVGRFHKVRARGLLIPAQEARRARAEDDRPRRRHGRLGRFADDGVVDGEVVLAVDVEEPADAFEKSELTALRRVHLGLAQSAHDRVDRLVGRHGRREVVLLAEVDRPLDHGRVAAAQRYRNASRDDAADGHGLAVREAAQRARPVRDGFYGVCELVAVDQHDGLAFFLGVDVDDLALELDRPPHGALEKVEIQQIAVVVVEHLEQYVGVLAERVLDDLAEPVGEEPVVQRH